MLLAASNKMSAKTHSVVLNFNKYGHNGRIVIKQYENYLSVMPRNPLDKDELKAKVHKLKHEIDNEPETFWQGDKDLANKYLNRVLDIIDEYRY